MNLQQGIVTPAAHEVIIELPALALATRRCRVGLRCLSTRLLENSENVPQCRWTVTLVLPGF